jgi:hypothetical protein
MIAWRRVESKKAVGMGCVKSERSNIIGECGYYSNKGGGQVKAKVQHKIIK